MKIFQGKVISTKLPKTAKVAVVRTLLHPVYQKRLKRTQNYLVHDELGVEVGQTVRFADSKPYSKMKKWKIVAVVNNKIKK